jgi:NarL family two-component system sensor histidine kinase LiaS
LGQLAQDLNQMARQVQTLLASQQRLTLLEERQRMARDLHDSVKQHTFGMALLMGAEKNIWKKIPHRPVSISPRPKSWRIKPGRN